jgi:CubicO group peptidase (beta-lactamase class C family)
MRLPLRALLLVASVLTLAADSPRPAPTPQALTAILDEIRTQHDVPALAAAVVNSDGPVAVAAVGVRKRGTRVPVTPDDQFHLGSNTKAMTGTLLGFYVEKGDLDYNMTLDWLFPDMAELMSPRMKQITLAHLLTHRAGFPHDIDGGWGSIPPRGSLRDQRREVLKRALALKLDFEPGTKYQYSNLGYVLAGHAAEIAGNASWEDQLTEKLFKPLGMTTAGFGGMGTLGQIDQPYQHRADGSPLEKSPIRDNAPVMGPAGTVHCSLPDWSRFASLHLRRGRGQPQLLRPETFQKLHTFSEDRPYYALGGWLGNPLSRRVNGLVLAHDGTNTHNHASIWLAPERHFGILVACNQGGDNGKKACDAVRARLIKEYLPEQ